MRGFWLLLIVLIVLPTVFAQEVIITVKPVKPIIYINEIAEYNVSITPLKTNVSLIARSPTTFWEISTKDILDVPLQGLSTIIFLKPLNSKTGEQIVPVEFKVKNNPFKITKQLAVEILQDIKIEDHPGLTGFIEKDRNHYRAIINNEKVLFLNNVTLRLLFKEGVSDIGLKLNKLERKSVFLNISPENILAKAIIFVNLNDKLFKFDLPIRSLEEKEQVLTPVIKPLNPEEVVLNKQLFKNLDLGILYYPSLIILVAIIMSLLFYYAPRKISVPKLRRINIFSNFFILVEDVLIEVIFFFIYYWRKCVKKLKAFFSFLGIIPELFEVFLSYLSRKSFSKIKEITKKLTNFSRSVKFTKPSLSIPQFSLPRIKLPEIRMPVENFSVNIFFPKKIIFEKKVRFVFANGRKQVRVFLTVQNSGSQQIDSIKILDLVPKQYSVAKATEGFQKIVEQGTALMWKLQVPVQPGKFLKLDYFIDADKSRQVSLPKAKLIFQTGGVEKSAFSKDVVISL